MLKVGKYSIFHWAHLGHLGWFSPIYVRRSRDLTTNLQQGYCMTDSSAKNPNLLLPPRHHQKKPGFFPIQKKIEHTVLTVRGKMNHQSYKLLFKGVWISSIIPYFCAWGRMVLTFLNSLRTTTPWGIFCWYVTSHQVTKLRFWSRNDDQLTVMCFLNMCRRDILVEGGYFAM